MTETQLVKQILEFLQYKPGKFWRMNTGATKFQSKGKDYFVRFGVPGQADITGIIDGKRIELEIKIPGGVQSDNQKQFQQMIEDNGGVYILAYSLDDVVNGLKKYWEL